MKLYFIRHGETVWNTQAKLQGKSDIPLNEKGVALARVTGEALADVPFAAIYSSPLKRALQTAQLVAGDRDVPSSQTGDWRKSVSVSGRACPAIRITTRFHRILSRTSFWIPLVTSRPPRGKPYGTYAAGRRISWRN